MSDKKIKRKRIIKKFDTISLDGLNKKAKLLDRSEVKYIVHQNDLTGLFRDLMKYFDILSIDDKKIFKYESIYMDTSDREFYNKHNDGFKNRIKVRTRRYIDSDLHFFEFKHRDHDVIRKYRYTIDANQHGVIDGVAEDFVQDTHKAIYGEGFAGKLTPSMVTTYKRVTFVHKHNEERLTIDLDLSFGMPNDKKEDHQMPPIAIIEAKTKEKHTHTHDIFNRHNIMTKNACSKYCLAHYYLKKVPNWDHFEETIEHIANLAKEELYDIMDETPNVFCKDQTMRMKNSSLIMSKEYMAN